MFTLTQAAAALALTLGLTAAAPPAAKDLTFQDLNGKAQRPLDVSGAKAHVLFFVFEDCPVSDSYAPEINALVKEHAGRPVRFYVIHVDPDLTPADARKHATAFGYRCPVLLDTRHQLVRATGVTTTPEVAVLTPGGGLAYRGRIDDLYPELGRKRAAPTKRDLREALAAVLAGKPVPVPRTEAVGCSIPDLP
jgi:thiol-disulfide isomerase/thioredoxin